MAYLFQSGSLEVQLSGGMDLNYSELSTDKRIVIEADGSAIDGGAGTLQLGAGGDAAVYYNDTDGLVMDTKTGEKVALHINGTEGAFYDDNGFAISTGDAYYIDTAATLQAGELHTNVSSSGLTKVGALGAGSIAAGFGDIDNGTSTIQTGGKLVIDVVGTGINNVGALTMGAAQQGGVYADATGLVLDAKTGLLIDFSVAGVKQAHLDVDGFDLLSGNEYLINNTTVLHATGLGTAVTGSSLTTLGTITSLVATTADINGGSVDDATIGATTQSSVKATTISGSSTLVVDGSGSFNNGVTFKAGTEITMNINADTPLAVATDALYFLDATDGFMKVAGVGSFLTDIAGSGLAVSAGNQLTTEGNTVNGALGDENKTIDIGMNYGTSSLTADRTWTLPALSGLDAGDVIRVKAPPSLATFALKVKPNAADKIDDLSDGASVDIMSDNGSISLMKVDATMWKIF